MRGRGYENCPYQVSQKRASIRVFGGDGEMAPGVSSFPVSLLYLLLSTVYCLRVYRRRIAHSFSFAWVMSCHVMSCDRHRHRHRRAMVHMEQSLGSFDLGSKKKVCKNQRRCHHYSYCRACPSSLAPAAGDGPSCRYSSRF